MMSHRIPGRIPFRIPGPKFILFFYQTQITSHMTDQPDTFKEMIEGPGVEPNPEWKNIKEENWKAWEEINNKKNGEEELKKSKANMRLVQEIHKEKVKHRESKKTIKFYIEKNERLLDKIKLEKRRREWWQEEYRKQEERMSDILDDNKS